MMTERHVLRGRKQAAESGESRALAPGIMAALPQRRALSDPQVVALAGLVWFGAALARPWPLGPGLLLLAVALFWRWPWLLLIACFVLANSLGHRAIGGLEPLRSAQFEGTITLLSDPLDGLGRTTADVRIGTKRLQLSAAGSGRGSLATLLAGEQIAVSGRIRPPPPNAPWLVPRHVVGLLDATSVEPAGRGAAPWRAANVLRRTLERGSVSLSPERRSLFTGLVLGDDRRQTATLTDDFRGSGLTHLLAVSGENVAFVLTLVGPLLRRLRLGPRWLLTVAVIGFFALVTRFEPSVTRAGVMAGLAATAFLLGRPAPGLRLLGLAVGGLVLVDPLLTRSVGFQLSVAASAGILIIAPRLRDLLPGPRWLTDPFAVTAGAQLAVAPLLITTFSGLPVASLPANLLAGPAAGLVMTWGLGAGIPAGLIGGHVAELLHMPTSWGVGWIAAVARAASALPLGELQIEHLLVLTAAVVVGVAATKFRWVGSRLLLRIAATIALVGLLAPALTLRYSPNGAEPVPGGRLWRAGNATVLVVGPVRRVEPLLEALRRAGVRRVDLLVLARATTSAGRTFEAVAHRWPPTRVWAADPGVAPGAVSVPVGSSLAIGAMRVTVLSRAGPDTEVSVDL